MVLHCLLLELNTKWRTGCLARTWITYVSISGDKCSIFGKFGVLCFLETPVLRFAHLPYYRRYFLLKTSTVTLTNQLSIIPSLKLLTSSTILYSTPAINWLSLTLNLRRYFNWICLISRHRVTFLSNKLLLRISKFHY